MIAEPTMSGGSRFSSDAQIREEVLPDQEVIQLFDDARTALRRYMILLGTSPEDADDGVQEAFLRLHKHLESGRERGNLRGWLFQVAKNLVRDRRKSAWIRRV